MLQAATQKAVALNLPQLAVQILVLDTGERRARDGNRDAGARETALVGRLQIAPKFHDFRVDHHQGVTIVLAGVVHIDHDQPLVNPHLGRRDATTVVGVHGMGHLLGELAEGLVLRVAGLTHLRQTGIGRKHYFEHGLSLNE